MIKVFYFAFLKQILEGKKTGDVTHLRGVEGEREGNGRRREGGGEERRRRKPLEMYSTFKIFQKTDMHKKLVILFNNLCFYCIQN